MNTENKKILWSKILEAGDFLNGKLPNHPNHPKGRNPYAHIALEIKNKFKNSYKDLPNERFNEIIDYVETLKNNTN